MQERKKPIYFAAHHLENDGRDMWMQYCSKNVWLHFTSYYDSSFWRFHKVLLDGMAEWLRSSLFVFLQVNHIYTMWCAIYFTYVNVRGMSHVFFFLFYILCPFFNLDINNYKWENIRSAPYGKQQYHNHFVQWHERFDLLEPMHRPGLSTFLLLSHGKRLFSQCPQ